MYRAHPCRTTRLFNNAPAIACWLPVALVALAALSSCDRPLQAVAAATTPPAETESRDPNRLWCSEHGVYEDECGICHPELGDKNEAHSDRAHGDEEGGDLTCCAQASKVEAATAATPSAQNEMRDPNRLWCSEHGVYEDECGICHPELGDKNEAHSDHAHGDEEGGELMCAEHRLPEAKCGNCRPDALTGMPVGEGLKLRFASDASIAKAGVETAKPDALAEGAPREFLGQVTFNRNQLANVTPLAPGVVLEVRKDVGQTVELDETVAIVRSPELAQVKREYREALADLRLASQTLAREKDLHAQRISPRQDLEAAQAAATISQSAVDEARQHLQSLGLTAKEIDSATQTGPDGPAVPVRAPFAGTIIERTATRGQSVVPGDALYQVADLSTMWMEFAVPEDQLGAVRTGAHIQARFEAYPGMSFDGVVQWIAPAVDARTRMINARAELQNTQGLLRDGLFGRATLEGATDKGVAVPESAIQDVDGRPVVFRRLESDLFETRPVELGAARDGHVVILAGLSASDEIVTDGSYIVKSELLKVRLGAGCTDH